MKSENQNSNTDEILTGIGRMIYKKDEELALYKSGIKTVTNLSAEKIRKNREACARTKYVEDFLEEETLDPEWHKVKEFFFKMHYFWDVWRTDFEMKAFNEESSIWQGREAL